MHAVGTSATDRAPDGVAEPVTVVVVGGGAAGILSTVNLLARGVVQRVVLVEGRPRFGPGVAYSTQDDRHLLNVPAARMSASVDTPDDFVDWLATSGRAPEEVVFAPRRLYAAYLEDTLAHASSGRARLDRMWGEAAAVTVVDGRYRVTLADRRTVDGDGVVLAIGAPPSKLAAADAAGSFGGGRYIADPWEAGALDVVNGGSALLVGTGLTMVDVALVLARRGVGLHAVSRHGLIPLAHRSPATPPVPVDLAECASLRELVRTVRRAAAAADDWRAVVDGLRPVTQSTWRSLTVEQQGQFLRHARRHWDAHRHRVAPAVGAELAEWVKYGQLVVSKGAVVSVAGRGARLRVVIRDRRTGEERGVDVDHVVNCTGPGVVTGTGGQPLVRAIVDAGLATLDPHDLGVMTTDDGGLVAADGTSGSGLYALGALRRGMLWESTAIPEVRAQAAALAESLSDRLTQRASH